MRSGRFVFIKKDTFPREVATPRRNIVFNWEEFKEWLEKHQPKIDCYTSVYSFDETKNFTAQYHTARIDKIYFDFDPHEDGTGCWNQAKKLHNGLKKMNIKHNVVFSGGGFHIYLYTNQPDLLSKRRALGNCARFFLDKFDIEDRFVDTSVIGDPSQITRIPNSYNFKDHRQRYCIPLNEEHMKMSYEEIREEAKTQNWNYKTWGSHKVDLVDFDRDMDSGDTEITAFVREDLEQIDLTEEEGLSIEHVDFPRCIQRILKKGKKGGHVGFRERFIIICWLKEMVVDIEDAKDFLEEHLTGTKSSRPNETDFEHMLGETYHKYGQLSDVYQREESIFPNHESLIKEGFCKPEWGECQQVYRHRQTYQKRDPEKVYKEQKEAENEKES